MTERTRSTSRLNRSIAAITGAALAWLGAACPGCRGRTPAPPPVPADAVAAQAALAAAQLVIHPLTRIGPDATGAESLLVYLELRDQFGQGVKALGQVRVDLYAPGAGGVGSARAERSWEIDLRDPDRNALLYDGLITRTYALTLGDLPAWAGAWAREGSGAGPRVVVRFTPFESVSTNRVMEAEVRLGK